MRFLVLGLATAVAAMAAGKLPGELTFHKDVLPLLQKNCQGCHRPGEAASMSLLTYKDARPWAKAMREAVLSKRMPPWFADPTVGKFSNDRSLNQADIETLVNWADSGAREGSPKDAPPPRQFVDGWIIGAPDVVFEMPKEYEVAASGTIEYTYVILPTGFTEDKWVQKAEVRPGNRAVLHHVIAFIREPGSKWMREYATGEPFVPKRGNRDGGQQQGNRQQDDGPQGEFITGFAPGSPPEVLREGQAKLVKAGSDIVFQLHYTANGKPARDKTKVGFIFARQAPSKRVLTLAAATNKFVIPAGAPSHAVEGGITLHADSELISLLPHMHLRGKSMEIRAIYPTGEKEVLVWVPRYDFNWQLWYQMPEPKLLPKGTRIEATGTFDNSRNNPHNPDPTVEVRYGDQSWEEMMMGFFDVAIDVQMDARDLVRAKKPPARSDD